MIYVKNANGVDEHGDRSDKSIEIEISLTK